ncbi:NUDIX domain-containing protein [Alistipes sp. OttesenSCG-928-B03]|nr:NUDIX domain-containing protein [Alistipes sp. OttesenSCG-928-B03]
MNKVFFEDKVINFMGLADAAGAGAVVELAAGERIGIAKVLENFGNSKELSIKSPQPQAVFDAFCSGFAPTAAAGGLVHNADGEPLMIFRRGWWDLPKGHIDAGETELQCAVREVGEECGLRDVIAGRLITHTLHIYELDGLWTMKRTGWFAMQSGQQHLSPETAEDIERAEWIRPADLPRRLAASYPTICEVFAADLSLKLR